ncbi:MAG: primosomal protein N' [Fibrobacter sp.]|nr:primosomal protein N' [Fibrobacter sp.]
MAKRIPKTEAPKEVAEKRKSSGLSRFCEVYIPLAPAIYTYGVPEGVNLERGSVVWVQFATRKNPVLALVARVSSERPAFDVRCAYPHASGYVFNERYMDALEWVARYYISTPMKALNVFWPSDFGKYLDALAACSDADVGTESADADIEGEASSIERANAGLEGVAPLTDEQQVALDALVARLSGTGFRGALLHGVTGSGKTRVYQELARVALERGLRVLILVPEIGLTPQTAGRFESFLGVHVPVLHSALSAPKKRDAYVSVLQGKARVVLGTRSAILAPFDFDVVILDEEHDSSFKQQDPAPRYHTRELAFHLAHKYGALVVLGSATPALETFYNANQGHLELLSLKKRATAAPLPDVKTIDMAAVRQQKGMLLSPELRESLTECVSAGEQAIVLMNRRGYSKIRVCSSCGETLYCKHCHVPLVYHRQYRGLLCHYCNMIYPENIPCGSCGAETYEYVGGAIEKLEEEILEWIPEAHVVRMDRDTTQNVGSVEKILESFRNREYNILLGTQMVAKGHDFPGVRLVGIVGADSGLGIPDFRGTERLFQLLSQTAGRAGRAQGGGRVLIQTLNPSEPVMQYALNHDYAGFARSELSNRKVALYPPFCKLVSVSVGSRDESALNGALSKLEALCKKEKSLTVLGPVEAFVPVVQNVHWSRLYLKTQDLAAVRNVLSPVVNHPKGFFSGVEIKVEIE